MAKEDKSVDSLLGIFIDFILNWSEIVKGKIVIGTENGQGLNHP